MNFIDKQKKFIIYNQRSLKVSTPNFEKTFSFFFLFASKGHISSFLKGRSKDSTAKSQKIRKK